MTGSMDTFAPPVSSAFSTHSAPSTSPSGRFARFFRRCWRQEAREVAPAKPSLEDVMNGRAAYPCSRKAFMDYLIHVEMAAENMQFWLWYHDYNRRYRTAHLKPLTHAAGEADEDPLTMATSHKPTLDASENLYAAVPTASPHASPLPSPLESTFRRTEVQEDLFASFAWPRPTSSRPTSSGSRPHTPVSLSSSLVPPQIPRIVTTAVLDEESGEEGDQRVTDKEADKTSKEGITKTVITLPEPLVLSKQRSPFSTPPLSPTSTISRSTSLHDLTSRRPSLASLPAYPWPESEDRKHSLKTGRLHSLDTGPTAGLAGSRKPSATSLSALSTLTATTAAAATDTTSQDLPRKSLSKAHSQASLFPSSPDEDLFREELDRAMATYLITGARRQLAVSPDEQQQAMRSLTTSLHPDALSAIYRVVDYQLRLRSFPNFVEWSVANANTTHLRFVRGVSYGLLTVSLLLAVVCCVSSASRAARLVPLALAWVAWMMLLSAHQTISPLLYLQNHRQMRPWECIFADYKNHDHEALSSDTDHGFDLEKGSAEVYESTSHTTATSHAASTGTNAVMSTVTEAFLPFGSANPYPAQPWTDAHGDQRPLFRRVFAQSARIREREIRRVHHKLVGRAAMLASLLTAVASVVLLALPVGGLF